MNFIKEITYGTLSGGIKNGIVAYEIVFNGQEPDENGLHSLASIIELILKHSGRACNRVHLRGPFPVKANDMVYTLIAGFKSEKIEVHITLDGQYLYQWNNMVDGITVHLKKPDWIGFPYVELIYDLADPNSPEPRIPEVVNPLTPLYVNPVGELASSRREDIFKFIQKASKRWNVNANCKVLKEYLYGEN